MTAASIPDSQQCRLLPRQAITLRPGTASRLTVIEGRAWITTKGPHGGNPQDSGDLVLTASSPALDLAAGQCVVVEPYDAAPVVVRTAVVLAQAGRGRFARTFLRRDRSAPPVGVRAP